MRTQKQLEQYIQFIQNQIDSLPHYLPETYGYLMQEMDSHQRDLMVLKTQAFYDEADS